MYRNISDDSLYHEGDEFKPGEPISAVAVADKDWLGERIASGLIAQDED